LSGPGDIVIVVVVLDLVRNLCETSLGTSARELAQLNVGSVLLRTEPFPESLHARSQQIPDLDSGLGDL